jgi:uncharacterized protein (DUF1684 family)
MTTTTWAGSARPRAAAFASEWQAWHADHEARRAGPHGFLAITGLSWLHAEPVAVPGVPGLWSTSEAGPRVVLAEGDELDVDGERVVGHHDFGLIPERGSVFAHAGAVDIEIARRGGNDIVRPRDPEYPVRLAYTGTDAYPADPDWAIRGSYTPYAEPQAVTVGSVVEGLEHVYHASGSVEFEVAGKTARLTVLGDAHAGTLTILFTDETSGVTTYPANRALSLAQPGADGTVLLDFNRATNLPCAYTQFATCPLPPAGNHIPFPIEAGEKKP